MIMLAVSMGLLILIIALVRNRKLRKEYSFLWILLGLAGPLIVFWNEPLRFFSNILGIFAPSNMLFLFAIVFLVILSLYFSVKISSLTNHVKILMQEIVLLKDSAKALTDSGKEI
jgi:hypothetical protein